MQKLVIWQTVPAAVQKRYKIARAIQSRVYNHDCDVLWQPDTDLVVVNYVTEPLIKVALPKNFEIFETKNAQEFENIRNSTQIVIKLSSFLEDVPVSIVSAPHKAFGKLFGGPSALTNSIVSGAIGAGSGYAAGHLMANLLPEEYVKRKNFAKYFAMMGGLGGAAIHLPEYLANLKNGNGLVNSAIKPHSQQYANPNNYILQKYLAGEKVAEYDGPYRKSVTGLNTYNDPIPVDRFNRVIWSNAGDNPGMTPPPVAAATSGLVTGISQMYGNPSILTPKHFINGMVAAGVDVATAHVAGGALGALGILTPQAQQQLKQIGLWSGILRGVTASVFK